MAGDEVSMTVEETNAMRAKLGLKPLSVAPASSQKRPPPPAKEPAGKAEEDGEEVRQRLLEIRREREERKGVKLLGDKWGDADDDLGAWVQKSRKIESDSRRRERMEAERRERALLEQDGYGDDDGGEGSGRYTSSELRGLKIGHRPEQMQGGGTAILTLKDEGILDDGGDLNEGADVLEDTLVAEQEKGDLARKRAAPSKHTDAEGKGILAKYDDPAAGAEATFMEIGGGGEVDRQAAQEQGEVRKRMREGLAGRVKDSAAGAMKKVLDNFWTPAEVEAMEAGKAAGKKRRRKKKSLRLKKQDIDELEEQAGKGQGAEAAHLGSRTEGAHKVKAAGAYLDGQARRDEAYSQAVQKAARASQGMRGDTPNPSRKGAAQDIAGSGGETKYWRRFRWGRAWAARFGSCRSEASSRAAPSPPRAGRAEPTT